MPITPEDFDVERSRSAVTVACLQWLGCTGPSAGSASPRSASTIAANLRESPSGFDPSRLVGPMEEVHPLWDRWVDG